MANDDKAQLAPLRRDPRAQGGLLLPKVRPPRQRWGRFETDEHVGGSYVEDGDNSDDAIGGGDDNTVNDS